MKHALTKRSFLTSAALSAMLLAGCAPAVDTTATTAAPAVTSAATPSAMPDLEAKTKKAEADKAAAEKAKKNQAAKEKAAAEKAAKEKAAAEKAAKDKKKTIDAAKIELASKKTPVNPLTNDADKDSLTDAWEIDHGTNPNNADTDGDGHGDREEYFTGTSLTDKNDYPGKPAPKATPKAAPAPAPAPAKVEAPKAKVTAPVQAPLPPVVTNGAAAVAAPKAAAPAPVKKVEAAPSGGGLNWSALAQCESGGNASAWNPAGYGGLYQFDQQTWNSVGGSGNPASASAAEQTKRAQILYSQRGSSPWPVCGAQL